MPTPFPKLKNYQPAESDSLSIRLPTHFRGPLIQLTDRLVSPPDQSHRSIRLAG
jgi:hypothetical protein